ncbi:MAG: type II secretion system major pseudopilin GspG [Planctomycetota bacterium]|nr:type II secretion system major pseudopilin GspG [Planctomycetota bacterium]
MKPNPRTSPRGGFTLIELLLVMAILAALAAIVVPNLTGRAKDAQIQRASLDIKNIGTAIKSFQIDCSNLPAKLEDLLVQPSDVPPGKWKGPYLEQETELPKDPWGNQYKYVNPGSHNTHGFDLYSFGPDGQDGGSDDIDNWSPPK